MDAGEPELRTLAMLILSAYVFLLRIPSEGIPLVAHANAGPKPLPVFKVHRDQVELYLARRKNRLYPSSIHRPCWCKSCMVTCPVHVLGAYMASLPPGAQPFAQLSPDRARTGLRLMLAATGVPQPELYWLHDVRRGHAEDLRRGGATLGEILRAGA